MNISEYIKNLEIIYRGGISYKKSTYSVNILNSIPKQLSDFYTIFESMDFPFGNIYAIENAIEMSQKTPFNENDWFCFGQDNYFSFWLCKKGTNNNDVAFTVWDHESGEDIDEPCFDSLLELIDFLSDDYENSDSDKCEVVIESCDTKGLKELMTLRKIFASSYSITEIKEQVESGRCIIKDNINWYVANRLLADHKFEHVVISVNKY